MTFLLAVSALLPAATPSPVLAQPSTVAYQGELKSGGTPFDGTAGMKAAIVEGGLTKWSNDGTSTFGSEPSASFSVTVVGGIFSVRLGDTGAGMVPLTADLFDLAGYTAVLRIWVDTGSGFEQLPDQPLSSSLFSIASDAAKRSVSDFAVGGQLMLSPSGLRFSDGSTMTTVPAGSDSIWTESGQDIYRYDGNVGIGTLFPQHKLDVIGDASFAPGNGQILVSTPGSWPGLIAYSVNGYRRDVIFDDNGLRLLADDAATAPPSTQGLTVDNNGWVGVGTSFPAYPLQVYGTASARQLAIDHDGTRYFDLTVDGGGSNLQIYGPGGSSDPGLELTGTGHLAARNTAGAVTATLDGQAFSGGSQMRFYRSDGTLGVEVTGGASEIKCFDSSGSNSVLITGHDGGGNGRVRTDVLEITGGSDLSERFDISGHGTGVEPGLVVSIDRHHPGRLVVSDRPYQKTVAGVVSGAGGVRTGMLMGQSGTAADGKHPVALTGRVWVRCDAAYGPIEPGDLLTTSATAGHAMVASDHERAQGAVIGKAMTSLRRGRGLVLVLVGLQ